jgi:MoaA/NifB/PqqE/SkfB family radical SAM enzyme
MRTIYIQNNPIQIKDEECICNQMLSANRSRPIEKQHIDITFIIGEKCNANCAFCCGPTDQINSIDINKFKSFFKECLSQISVRKITFTGGEPTLPVYFPTIKEIGLWIKSISPSTDIIINTNGTNLGSLANQSWITTIALSRHHYKSSLNDSLMKTFTADEVDIMMFDDKKKISLACVCQKNYIDSGKELEAYLKYAALMGIHTVGVYSLIPSTEYAKQAYIDPFKFEFSNSVLQYKTYDYPCKNICQCKNFVYLNRNDDMNSVFFYMRKNINHLFNKGSYIVWKNNEINFF